MNVCMRRWRVCTVMLNAAPSTGLAEFCSLMPERLSVLSSNRIPPPCASGRASEAGGPGQCFAKLGKIDGGHKKKRPQRILQPSCLNTGAQLTGLTERKPF